jgi:hypothetical protein
MLQTQNRKKNMTLTIPRIAIASPQFITPMEPMSMQDALDQAGPESETYKDLADQRGKLLLETLQLNATLIDAAIAREEIVAQQEVTLTHQTAILTLMTEFINLHIEAGSISPQLSELADKITSSNAYASAAWMSDQE